MTTAESADFADVPAAVPPASYLKKGDLFGSADYYVHEVATGVTLTLGGERVVSFPEGMFTSMRSAFASLLPEAPQIELHERIGRLWGERLARTLRREIHSYYGIPVHEAPVALFQTMTRGLFRARGLGDIRLDCTYYDQGVLVVDAENSPFTTSESVEFDPGDVMFRAMIAGFFSSFAGRKLGATPTTANGARTRLFITIPERLEKLDAADARESETSLLDQLLASSVV